MTRAALLAALLVSCGPSEYAPVEPSSLQDRALSGAAQARALVAQGAAALPALEDMIRDPELPLSARGEAVLAASQIEDAAAGALLEAARRDANNPEIVRVWAAAGLIRRTTDAAALLEMSTLVDQWPALKEPIGEALGRASGFTMADRLVAVQRYPALKSTVVPAIFAADPEELVAVALTHEEDAVRRQAAAWLGAWAGENGAAPVVEAITQALDFQGDAAAPPWAGGALFLPSLDWGAADGGPLVRNLFGWRLFAARTEDPGAARQLAINLRSLRVQTIQIGAQRPQVRLSDGSDVRGMVAQWARFSSAADARALIREAGLDPADYEPLPR